MLKRSRSSDSASDSSVAESVNESNNNDESILGDNSRDDHDGERQHSNLIEERESDGTVDGSDNDTSK